MERTNRQTLMTSVDTSAMIAMMTGESDADDPADRLGRHQSRLCFAISIWETVAGLHRSCAFASGAARAAYAAVGKGRIRRPRRPGQITPSAASPAASAALMPSSDVSAHSVSSP